MASYTSPIVVKSHYGIKQIVKGNVKPKVPDSNTWNMEHGIFPLRIGDYSPDKNRITETATHHYTYSRSGMVSSVEEKQTAEMYADWLQRNVRIEGKFSKSGGAQVSRITPLSDYEKTLGITKQDSLELLPCYRSGSCHHEKGKFNVKAKLSKYEKTSTGKQKESVKDFVSPLIEQKEEELRQRIADEEAERALAEQLRLREIALTRPNPKQVEKVELTEVESNHLAGLQRLIMIAGVIVVIGVVLIGVKK